ncbi:MAG: NYN domain-containing protein [bacterium]|nr:NYN domain-containing protein [bacterium]
MNQLGKSSKDKGNYAFIDGQNLNMGIKKLGWNLDFRKFHYYLQRKYGVTKAYFFVGMVEEQADLYANLLSMGYTLILKPTVEHKEGTVKGNIDADLVLHAMIELDNYEKAIVVSGDGDFYSLYEYLQSKNKLGAIVVPNRQFSSLLNSFLPLIVRLDGFKRHLAYKKGPRKITPEPTQ